MAAKINDGGPAFRVPVQGSGFGGHDEPGMTIRDYFAANALAFWARMNIGGWCGDIEDETAMAIARHAYALADAMLKARESRP